MYLNNVGDLSNQDALYLKNLYSKSMVKVPIISLGNKGIFFGELSKQAGFDENKIDETKKFLRLFVEPIYKRVFNEGI